MTYAGDGRALEEFRADRPVSKLMVSRAVAGNAERFPADLVAVAPFPIPSIQVDGGSEFTAGFEDACERLGVPLRVLPPRRPQWNGCVERANRSAGIEFRNRRGGSPTVAAAADVTALRATGTTRRPPRRRT